MSMKKQMLLSAIALAISVQVGAAVPDKVDIKPLPAQTQAAVAASQVLSRFHYKATPLDDAMSEKIFDRYFKLLDSDKLFFVQSDLDQFAPARTKLDDAIMQENLSVPFAIYNLYQQRFNERMAYARGLLKGKFDFTSDEQYQIDRKKPNGRKMTPKPRICGASA